MTDRTERWMVRKGEHRIGAGSRVEFPAPVAITAVPSGWLATAVKDAQDALHLSVWDITPAGQFIRLADTGNTGDAGDAVVGPVWSVATAALGAGRLATAAQGSGNGGTCRVDIWDVSAAGPLRRTGGAQADDLQAFTVAIATLGRNRLATAVLDRRSAAHAFRVVLWELHADGQRTRLVRQGDAETAFASEAPVEIVAFGEHRLVTANTSGRLELIVWDVTPEGQLVRRGSNVHPVDGYVVAVAALGSYRLATVHRSPGQLQLVIWEVAPDGRVVRVGGGGPMRSASRFDATVTALGADRVVTAWRDEQRRLALIAWEVAPGGHVLRSGVGTAGTAGTAEPLEPLGPVAAAALGPDRLVIAGTDERGDVVLSAWDVVG